MKMEKLNENQLKVDIYKEDLIDRNIKLSEIFYGGEKVREFFHELMEIAHEEHDFTVNNMPILVEALPMSQDEISLVVTKVSEPDDLQDKIEKIGRDSGSVRDLMNKLSARKTEKNVKEFTEPSSINTRENIIIFSFDNIDTVTDVSKRINSKFKGTTILYKNQSKYFLLLENKKIENYIELENILSEYGEKHISTGESKFYLKEHGEIIIKKDAIKILAENM